MSGLGDPKHLGARFGLTVVLSAHFPPARRTTSPRAPIKRGAFHSPGRRVAHGRGVKFGISKPRLACTPMSSFCSAGRSIEPPEKPVSS